MSSNRLQKRGTGLVAGAAALAVLMTGCGGSRVSREEIVQAAGAVQPVPAAGAAAGVPAVAGAVAAAPAGGTAASTGAAVAPATQSNAGASGDKSAPSESAGSTGGAATTSGSAKAVGPATKSVIRLGSVGTFSGPVGAVVKDTTTGLRVWAQWVNSRGGINGHPVEVLVADDGGDPGRYNSLLQQFVEKEGVLAFLYNTLGFAPAGNNKYLDSKKIFMFGSEGGTEVAYQNPYVLTSTPTGRTNADSMVLALGHAMKATGSTKLAGFACSDFSLCDNFDSSWSNSDVLKKAGFVSVARGRPSMTQPDYTANCLAAKQAGAEVLIFGMDTSAIRRFAGDCARQNYKPRLSTADLLALPDLPLDPNADGLVIGTKMAPFTDQRVPGIKECYEAFATFAPNLAVSGSHTNGWIIGEYFAAAAANLPDHPTPKDLEDGVYAIKNNNLKGMTYPITMSRGQPQPRQLCYGIVVIQDRKYTTLPGPSLYCEKNGKPMSSADDYGITGATERGTTEQGAPTRAALRASTSQSAAGGSVPEREGTIGVPTRARMAQSCPPARVAGLSYVLDAFQTGSAAGPGVFYGVALAALGTPLPEPLGQYQGQVLAESARFVETFSKDAPAAIEDARTSAEPFAAYNGHTNAVLDAGATALDGSADELRAMVQPGDRSMKEFAASLRDAQATSTPCAVVEQNPRKPVAGLRTTPGPTVPAAFLTRR